MDSQESSLSSVTGNYFVYVYSYAPGGGRYRCQLSWFQLGEFWNLQR